MDANTKARVIGELKKIMGSIMSLIKIIGRA